MRLVYCGAESRDIAYVDLDGPDGGNADAAFIAHAHQDVPWLLDLVGQLMEENEHLQWKNTILRNRREVIGSTDARLRGYARPRRQLGAGN
jgi:hypothetical protein